MTSRSVFSIHRTTWLLASFVLWGAWNAQTDCFPFNENQARPSWYVYGWPVCFGNSNRGRLRLNLFPFDTTALLFDVVITVIIVLATAFAVESLLRRRPRFTLLDILAVLTALSLTVFIWFGGFHKPLYWLLGAVPPLPQVSALAGNVRLASRLPPILVTVPLSLGLACLGFAMVKLPSLCFRRS